MGLRSVVAVLAGGGLGATLRYIVGVNIGPPTPPDFPWPTLMVNVVGSFALGAVMTLLAAGLLSSPEAKPFLVTGVLGGFTTWSHFIIQSDQLIGNHQTGLAIGYLVGSIVAGAAAAAFGVLLAEAGLRRRGSGAS